MRHDLHCSACRRPHESDRLQNLCVDCGKPLLVTYDLTALRDRFRPAAVRAQPRHDLWRFDAVLPAHARDAVSLGEGGTPLLEANRAGPFAPFEHLFVKDESGNPSGSFKARGLSAAVTMAKRLGAEALALPSAGNAGSAAALYGARAGLAVNVFFPADAPPANIQQARAAGAHVLLVDGLIDECGRRVREGCERYGWFDLSTLKEPFRIEGKKTMGYELALDFANEAGAVALPDVVVYPTGGGTGLIGMWKAFDEMQALGWIGPERPRLVVVQAANCAPIVHAFESGSDHAERVADASTVAAGLRVPAAIGDFLILRALRETRGTALSVTDDALLEGAEELVRFQGVLAAPEGGATWAAAKQLLEVGWIRPEERVVLFNTGSALTYLDRQFLA